jgi:hypothetical protein
MAACGVLEALHVSCCQVFPCKVYTDLNLRDTLRYG